MHRRLIDALLVYAAFATSVASAVALNPRGIGDVLIYPYYTVNRGPVDGVGTVALDYDDGVHAVSAVFISPSSRTSS
jgi:hypothetical protein